MTPSSQPNRSLRQLWLLLLVAAFIGGVAGALMAQLRGGGVVRSYLLANPQVLREAAEALRQADMAEALGPVRAEVERPFAGAVLGNAAGRHTLVEFTDYACTYCRRSIGDVQALIRQDPQLKVVIRELPILSPDSASAARMALAAARQGRYAAFHAALFAADGPSAANIMAAARVAPVLRTHNTLMLALNACGRHGDAVAASLFSLDGQRVGSWLGDLLARDAARPAAGPNFVDPRLGLSWAGIGMAP